MKKPTDTAIPPMGITSEARPLLTIAIPTYNRSGFLGQLLDSLVEQVRSEPRVEVLVSDNASTDGTASLIDERQRLGLRLRYLRNAENIGPDANFLQCFESASGKYVWIIGDDDLLLPGAVEHVLEYLCRDEYDLAYLSSIGFSGDDAVVKPPVISRKGVRIYTDPALFVKRVHIFMTLISCNIINKDRVATVAHEPFSKLVNTNLIQLGWTFTALRAHQKSLYFERPLVSYRTGNTGGYGVCRVFGATLRQVTEEWLDVPKLNQLILNATLQRFLPYCLMAANKQSHAKFQQEDAHALLSSVFHNNFRYWFFDYPVIVLPKVLASIWTQMIRVINRIDRAFGYPLLRW
jgi:glycosyltransferase involved in cell wall biosynthesis